jgi:hypothetical protein
MKAILAILVSLVATVAMAEDKIFTYYEEIYVGKDNYAINGYDDGYQVPDGYDYYSLNFKVEYNENDPVKSIDAEAFRGEDKTTEFTCKASKGVIRDGYLYVDIQAGVEDESDVCVYTVTFKSGKTAVVGYYEMGT